MHRQSKDHTAGFDNRASKISVDVFLQPPGLLVQVQRKKLKLSWI